MSFDVRQGPGWCRDGTTPNLQWWLLCVWNSRRLSRLFGAYSGCPHGRVLVFLCWSYRAWPNTMPCLVFFRGGCLTWPLWRDGRRLSWRTREAADALRCSGGVSVLPLMQAPPCVGPPSPLGPIWKFPHAPLAFGSALACGWSQLSDGWFSSDGRIFWTIQGVKSHLWSDGRDWLVSSIRSEAHNHTKLSLFLT